MNSTAKIAIGVVVVALIGGGVYGSMKYKERGVITVQTGKPVK